MKIFFNIMQNSDQNKTDREITNITFEGNAVTIK